MSNDQQKPRVRMNTRGQITQFQDGYGNVVAGIGGGRDKPSQGFYFHTTISDSELIAAYETSFLPKRIVDTVAEDATRRWRAWNASKDHITLIEKEEQRLRILQGVESAMKNARLLGGAGLYFSIRGQKPNEPLDINSVGKGDLRQVILFSQNELTEGDLETDIDDPNFGLPRVYKYHMSDGTELEIHHTRVIRFIGEERVAGQPRITTHWGRSTLQTALAATKNVDGSVAAIATLILEARIDVINVKGLMQKLATQPKYEQELLRRFSMASMSKSVNGTLVLDDLEQYQQKSQTYGSLPELIDRFFQYVSGASGIPVTRLFGTSPGGLNATGEADIRHYYDRVQTMQNNKITPSMALFDECLLRSALGRRPKNIFYTWRSLWQVSEKERAEIGKNIAETGATMIEKGMIDPYSMGQAVVTALTENESMPGIEEAWNLHQTIRNAPVEPVDLNKQTEAALARKTDPANTNSSPRSTGSQERVAANDERGPRPLYVHRKVLNAKDIIAWAKSQGIKSTYPADDMHVTVVYSKQPVDWMEMGESWIGSQEDGKLTVNPGGPREVDIFGDDCLVLKFANNDLRWRNSEMRERGASSDFPDYRPHITITRNIDGVNLDNIKPYVGKIELGPEIFEELDDDWSSKTSENDT